MLEPNTRISNARDSAYQNQISTINYWQSEMEHEELFKDTIEKYGIEQQITCFIEECGEALTAISRYKRRRAGSNAIIEELVDLSMNISILRLI